MPSALQLIRHARGVDRLPIGSVIYNTPTMTGEGVKTQFKKLTDGWFPCREESPYAVVSSLVEGGPGFQADQIFLPVWVVRRGAGLASVPNTP